MRKIWDKLPEPRLKGITLRPNSSLIFIDLVYQTVGRKPVVVAISSKEGGRPVLKNYSIYSYSHSLDKSVRVNKRCRIV
jgi:hypothetical protein